VVTTLSTYLQQRVLHGSCGCFGYGSHAESL